MKLYCPLSGISYSTNIGYGHGKAPHPTFYLPLKSLISQNLDAFTMGKLSEEETHLFGCALLHKLPVIWEVEVPLNENTKVIWRKYLEKLAACVLRYDSRLESDLPKYHIDRHSCNLGNLSIYLESLCDAVAELESDGDSPTPTYITRNAEATILRMLRGSMSRKEKQETFPMAMAEWAASVAAFPTELVTIAVSSKGTEEKMLLRDYWKDIVVKLFRETDPINILSTTITPADVDELIEHCETHLEIGSLHSLALMRRLRDAKVILDEFRSPAPRAAITVRKNEILTAQFLEGNENVSQINIDRPKVSIPKDEPLRRDYPNTAAYLRARIAWQRGY